MIQPLLSDHRLLVAPEIARSSTVRDEITFFPAESVTDDILDVWHMLAMKAPRGRQPKADDREKVLAFERPINKMFGGYR
jgi:hypothetical protein